MSSGMDLGQMINSWQTEDRGKWEQQVRRAVSASSNSKLCGLADCVKDLAGKLAEWYKPPKWSSGTYERWQADLEEKKDGMANADKSWENEQVRRRTQKVAKVEAYKKDS